MQALLVLAVLIFSLHIQHEIKPFRLDELNKMEILAILTATVTIYCGLFYLTKALHEGSKILLFVLMIVINLYFLGYWLVKMTGAGMLLVRQKFSCLKRFIRS